MSASAAKSTSNQGPHASGEALLAVAEGDPGRQPDETTLTHLFSCNHCLGALRDLRGGLVSLGNKVSASPLDSDDPLAAAFQSSMTRMHSASEARARKITSVMLGIGALCCLLLWMMKTWLKSQF